MMRLLLLLACLLPALAAAATQVNVVGLTSGKAVLVINGGKPRTMSVGETSPEGVKLIAADSSRVVVEIEGRRRELGMGQGASVAGNGPGPQTATLYANQAGHFFGPGSINGGGVTFLLDTGASSIVLSSTDARRLGIRYQDGQPLPAQTAAGVVRAWRVSLDTVKIGGITLHGVEGMVMDGDAPPVALLGMSALNRLDMRRDGLVMTLIRKY